MAVVKLDQLCKRYERSDELAVNNVSLEVQHGEFMVLLGPSGCGKTTTLRMIAGLESISSGTLTIDDRVVNRVPAKDRDIAMVFQSYALYPHMSVRENLSFGLRRRNVNSAEIERRVTSVAEALGLSSLLDRRPHALSGGQRQRVALGRAIVRDPKVFLFDEPLSNLDAALRVSTRQELARLHRRLAATMIYVTHDQVEAMTLGDRICVMSGGAVAQIGPPLEVYRRPASSFVARFLGSPPMNIVTTQLINHSGAPAVAFGAARLPIRKFNDAAVGPYMQSGRPVLFGIRPEDIVAADANGSSVVGEVQAIEPLGAETILSVSVDGNDILVRGGRELNATPGTRVGLRPDLQEIHLFDPQTGAALARAH
jgi:multiple sugar transport system ATP-binding protein